MQVECRCGTYLMRKSFADGVRRCEQCNLRLTYLARFALGPGGAVPDPETWVTV